jgi:uncharacterized repeat protein (TIGR03803 family)
MDDHGMRPTGRLLLASDGMIYGITPLGGPEGQGGTIYRIDPATFEYTQLHAFRGSRGMIGSWPAIGLVEGRDGRLYGATTQGNPYTEPGSLFAFDRTTRAVHLLHKFTGSGEHPTGELQVGPDGTLYGTNGGNPSTGDPGELFSIRANGRFEVVHAFGHKKGAYPIGGVMLGADGWLYGNTLERTVSGAGGNHSTMYRVRPNGRNFSMLYVYEDDSYRGRFLQRGNDLWDTSAGMTDNVFTLTLEPVWH